MTLKQRLERHRNAPACLSCHAKIDPWGIALEQFDATGGFRDEIGGLPVDASAELFNEQRLDGADGLKRFLLQHRQDQFVRALVVKLLTFALGLPVDVRRPRRDRSDHRRSPPPRRRTRYHRAADRREFAVLVPMKWHQR